jgi:hypothetical protein
MAVIVGSDGAAQINLGDGRKFIANMFAWNARLRREMLSRTTQADDYERRTGGMGDWSGSFSFRMQFSDDTTFAQSAWQLLNFAFTKTDKDLKAQIRLILQSHKLPPDCDIFKTTITGGIRLRGTVVISDVSINCEDPEQPMIAVVSWEGDGPMVFVRSDTDLDPDPEDT